MADTDVVDAPEVIDDEAAFAAGFNEVSGDPVVEVKPEPSEPVAESKPEAEPVTEEPQQEAQEETVTLNQSEVKALLGRLEELDKIKGGLRDLNGRYGTLSDSFNRLKEANATGGSVEISEEDLAELSEFGELKTSVGNVLKKVLAKAGTGGAVDLEPIETKFEQRINERDRVMEGRILTAYHRDWRQVTGGDEFRTWLQAQSEDYRDRINNSWNAEEIAQAIDSFKARNVKPQAQQNKTRRLETAVAHTGNAKSAPGIDDDAAFLAGFSAIRG